MPSDPASRLRLQIRAVLVVYRAERERANRRGTDLEPIRARSLEILDRVGAELDGKAPWHTEVRDQLAAAREEVSTPG
jgi:hypothetical protein